MNIPPTKTQSADAMSVLESQAPIHSGQMGLESAQAEVAVFISQDPTTQPIRRLIVLVPNVDLDEVHFAREVWEMAFAPSLDVLLLSLCSNSSEEPLIQRRLINLAAIIRHPRIAVETHIEYSRDWVRAIKSILEAGDVIVCHEEQHIGLRNKSLVAELSTLPASHWTLSGFYLSNPAPRPRWVSLVVFWIVTLAILAGFFYFQVQASYLADSLVKNIILGLSILAELGSLYFWNSVSATI